MEEVLVDVCEHAGRSLKGMVCRLQSGVIETVLVRCMARKDGGDVEYYGSLLVC